VAHSCPQWRTAIRKPEQEGKNIFAPLPSKKKGEELKSEKLAQKH